MPTLRLQTFLDPKLALNENSLNVVLKPRGGFCPSMPLVQASPLQTLESHSFLRIPLGTRDAVKVAEHAASYTCPCSKRFPPMPVLCLSGRAHVCLLPAPVRHAATQQLSRVDSQSSSCFIACQGAAGGTFGDTL